MVQFIFIEGPNTSGKSTVQKLVVSKLEERGDSCISVSEKEMLDTFLPGDMTFSKGKKKLRDVFVKYSKKDIKYVIFDRSHFSNVSYSKLGFENIREIDDFLAEHNSLMILLYYDEKTSPQRIRNSLEHRKETGFVEYFKSLIRGSKSREEEDNLIRSDFSSSLKIFEECGKKTRMKVLKIDVTDMKNNKDFEKTTSQIIKFIESNK